MRGIIPAGVTAPYLLISLTKNKKGPQLNKQSCPLTCWGALSPSILCCCQNKARDVVVIYLFDIISNTHTGMMGNLEPGVSAAQSLIGGGRIRETKVMRNWWQSHRQFMFAVNTDTKCKQPLPVNWEKEKFIRRARTSN